jgi:quinol monooxygenase YgiN
MRGPNQIDESLEDRVAYAVIAHYRCPAEDAGLIREALLTMREHTLKEPGNLAYEVHAEEGAEPPAFILYEQYADRAAFDAHAASAHFAEFILGTVRPRLTERHVLFGETL